MEGVKLHKDNNLLLEYYEKGNYIRQTWYEHITKEVFLQLLDIIEGYMMRLQPKGILVDATKQYGVSAELEMLAAKKYIEYTLKYGKFKVAFMVPVEVFSAYTVEHFNQKKKVSNAMVATMFFNDILLASEWLQG